MVAALPLFICFLIFYAFKTVESVPPEACFQNFRWDDCGRAAEPVMYYWKPGSRCEVGLWRGCLPNLNMFKDEYECVSTCIFASRANPEDYHNTNKEDELIDNGDDPFTNDTLYDTTTNASNGTNDGSEVSKDGDGENAATIGDGGADGGNGTPAADAPATDAPAPDGPATDAPSPDGPAPDVPAATTPAE